MLNPDRDTNGLAEPSHSNQSLSDHRLGDRVRGAHVALFVRRRSVWLFALAMLTLAGLSIYPVFLTGDEAGDAVRHTWYVVPSMVREHDAAAGFALWATLIMGAVSAYVWWRMVRREPNVLPPVWLRVVVTVIAAWALSVIVRTAYLGGLIVHESPRLASPPPGYVPPPDSNPGR